MNEEEHVQIADGRTISYAEYGDPKGRPVLFFHGWPSSRYQAAYLDPLALERGLRILAPDRPGIGGSTPVPDRHFEDWPADVAAFADALGIGRFAIFGISGGGPYTLATSATLGDRVIRAAVACGAPPLGEKDDRGHMHWAYKTLASSRRLRRAMLPALLPFSRWMVGRGATHAPMSWMLKSVPHRDREALFSQGGWDMVTRSYLEAIRNGPDSVLSEGELYLSGWNFDVSSIRVPIRFWHGKADANLPCHVAQRLAEKVPGAEGCWVEGEGHYSLAVFHSDEMLDWLGNTS
ncbi:alpha/beta fold hydrolase [Haloferula rosea]|uniref:Alpha/beta hydrolase n=1 Tax=Haloferula rosea TaxID=490093 RepID=A0A934VF73_9BACT|nr:alpha/beta hydrolase [Haloferula rosea]MBK1826771.1 alpha/beta hydrolase [Haloferula rosea]